MTTRERIAEMQRSGTPINFGAMPLQKNTRKRPWPDWQPTTCPLCGQPCWYQGENGELLRRVYPDAVFVCTECAMKGGRSRDDRQ